MVIIGGLDSVPGAIVGAFIVTMLPTLCTNLLQGSLGASAVTKGPQISLIVYGTLVIIFVLLYLTFRSFGSAALIMGTLPFALVGGLWLLFLLGYNLSIASAIGFIALAGVAAEFGVIMLIYLDHAIDKRRQANQFHTVQDLIAAIEEGAVLRVRPKAMTVAVIIAGLLPIMLGGGTGSEVMRRIAAPMVGGMITAPMLSMLVLPVAYLLIHRRAFGRMP